MKSESDFCTSLLSYLGFTAQQSPNSSSEKVFDNHLGPEADLLEKLNFNDGPSDRNKEGVDHLSVDQLDTSGDATDDGSEVFNNLYTPKGNTSPQLVSNHDTELIDGTSALGVEQQDDIEEEDIDKAIQHSLIAANYQGAIKKFLSSSSEAMLLQMVRKQQFQICVKQKFSHRGSKVDFSDKVNLNDGASDRNKEDVDHLSADPLDTYGNATDDGSEFFNNLDTPKGNTSSQLVSKHDIELIDGTFGLGAEQQDDIEEEDNRAI